MDFALFAEDIYNMRKVLRDYLDRLAESLCSMIDREVDALFFFFFVVKLVLWRDVKFRKLRFEADIYGEVNQLALFFLILLFCTNCIYHVVHVTSFFNSMFLILL